MGIVILLLSAYLFNKRICNESRYNKNILWGAVVFYFLFSLILNWYLRKILGWEHGIPGSDLTRYYNGAQALMNGTPLHELGRYDGAFELSITHIGYILYAVFIAITALCPVIISVEVSLQILYCVQAFAAIAAILNIIDFFVDNDDEYLKRRLLIVFLLCTSVLQCAAILMRDIWILFIITCLLRECEKKNGSIIKSALLIFIAFGFRYYSLVITIPILFGYRFKKKKLASIILACVFLTFFFGQGYINSIAKAVGIRYSYTFSTSVYSLLSYIMFPSPISQAYNVQHMNMSQHAIFGGNTEWIYYLLSCWNVYVYPVSFYGIYKSIINKKTEDTALWGLVLLNIAMLMCVFYGATSSPRHKLLIIISLAYFFKEGYQAMRGSYRIGYFFVVLIVLLLIFSIA